jgi:hypothetical protein
LWTNAFEIVEHDALDATTGAVEPVKKPEPKPVPLPTGKPAAKIVGEKGEWQIVAPGAPADGAIDDWLKLIQTSSHILLDLCSDEADVMQIFKKNKVLFDTVKGHDAVFLKEMMGKFTETKNKLTKE